MSYELHILLLLVHCSTSIIIFNFDDNETTIMDKVSSIPLCGKLHTCQDYHIRLEYIKDRKLFAEEFSCSCDSLCLYFNDCCPDATPNRDDLLPGLETLPLDLITCEQIRQVNRFSPIYFVNKCPPSWHGNATRAKCEEATDRDDLTTYLPVTGMKTGLMYKNMYCAMCHQTDYLYWKLEVMNFDRSFDSDKFLLNATLEELLRLSPMEYHPPNSNIDYRMCVTRFPTTSTCHPDFNISNIIKLCEQTKGQTLYYSPSHSSQNAFCAVCNFYSYVFCSSLNINPNFPPERYYSLTMLLDINTGQGVLTIGETYRKSTKNVTSTQICNADQVFNPMSMTCKNIVCEDSFILVDKRCLSNDSSRQEVHCFRVELTSTEYEIMKNGDLVELASGSVYTESEYYIKNTSAFVCSNLTQNYTLTQLDEFIITFHFSPAEIFVTLTGLSISLVALCITIVIYACIKELHNTPGKNLLSLSCALFLAELLMMIGPEMIIFPDVCRVVAVCMHYFFLAAFFWMSVMAADVWVTFTKSFMQAGMQDKSSKRFLGYSIFCWCGPALIVIASLMVEYLANSPTFKPNYGKGICWLTNKNALLMFFAGPLLLIILVNTCFFVSAASTIYRSKTSSARQFGNEKKLDLAIYVKLFLVMGLTWVVGFVAAMVSHPVLWYLFIILNTLQGLFIFLGFVMTSKVRRLVKKALLGDKAVTSRSSTSKRSDDISTKVVSMDYSTQMKESVSSECQNAPQE